MSLRRRPPGARYAALVQLLRTADTLWNASRLLFDRWDLSPSQFNILNLLHDEAAGLSQIRLSQQLIMHRSNMTGLVDRLEQRGFVRRRANAKDRRAYTVVLTPAGSRLVGRILPHFYQAAERVWGNFPVKRAEQLLADLQQLSAAAERVAQARENTLISSSQPS